MGERGWNKDEDSCTAAVSDQGRKGRMGDVFGNCGIGVWDRVEGCFTRTAEDYEGRKSLNDYLHLEKDCRK